MKILIETIGNTYRLSLPLKYTVEEGIQFANLAWVCGVQDRDGEEITSFCTSREKLRRAVKAYRIANTANWFIFTKWPAKARARGKFLPSGLSFAKVDQISRRGMNLAPYRTGNADNSEATVNVWSGYRSAAAKHFES